MKKFLKNYKTIKESIHALPQRSKRTVLAMQQKYEEGLRKLLQQKHEPDDMYDH